MPAPARSFSEPKIAPLDAHRVALATLDEIGGARHPALVRALRGLPPEERAALVARCAAATALAATLRAGTYAGVVVLKIRGYVRDSLGVPGVNDRNIFDDATVALAYAPGEATPYAAARVRSNVDPSRTGTRPDGRGYAEVVAPQLYFLGIGDHSGRPGLRQASPILVNRDGPDERPGGGYEFRQAPAAFPYTNDHDDRGWGTGSEGCSTYPPGEWAVYDAFVVSHARAQGQDEGAARQKGRAHLRPTVPCVLVHEDDRRAYAAAGRLAA